jgi:hypothetical protein
MSWQDRSAFYMNQRTFALLQTVSSAEGRPLFGAIGTTTPSTGFSFAGSPIHIVSQMSDVQPLDADLVRQSESGLSDRLAPGHHNANRSIFRWLVHIA